MTTRRAALALSALLALGLGACSREDASPGSTAAGALTPAQAVEAVAAEGRGFAVGTLMSAHPVYVLFDPQCPHCGHLWNAARPLQNNMRFVWLPVAILGPKSLPQGAALMQSADVVQAMNAHEQSLLAGQGGMAASANVPDDVAAAIRANTALLDRLGAESVPFIVARHARSGEVVTRAGAMDTAALLDFLGMGEQR
jgi:thiol:disulfide interchange protein DsbG